MTSQSIYGLHPDQGLSFDSKLADQVTTNQTWLFWDMKHFLHFNQFGLFKRPCSYKSKHLLHTFFRYISWGQEWIPKVFPAILAFKWALGNENCIRIRPLKRALLPFYYVKQHFLKSKSKRSRLHETVMLGFWNIFHFIKSYFHVIALWQGTSGTLKLFKKQVWESQVSKVTPKKPIYLILSVPECSYHTVVT